MYTGATLPEAKLAVKALKGDLEAWRSLGDWNTAEDLSVPARDHMDAGNYMFMCADTMSSTVKNPASAVKFREIVSGNAVPVIGHLTRGVVADDDPMAAAERFAESDRPRYLSFTRNPRIAIAFSKGVFRINYRWNGWESICRRATRRGYIVVAENIAGFHLPYGDGVFAQERAEEAEVVVEQELRVVDVLTSRRSIYGMPTVVVTGA